MNPIYVVGIGFVAVIVCIGLAIIRLDRILTAFSMLAKLEQAKIEMFQAMWDVFQEGNGGTRR